MSGPVEGVAEKLEVRAARFVKDKRLSGAAVGVIHGESLPGRPASGSQTE